MSHKIYNFENVDIVPKTSGLFALRVISYVVYDKETGIKLGVVNRTTDGWFFKISNACEGWHVYKTVKQALEALFKSL